MSSSDSGVGPAPGPLGVLSTGAEEEVELVPAKEEEEQEMVETGKKEEDGDASIESDSKKLRGKYFSSVVLVVRILVIEAPLLRWRLFLFCWLGKPFME